MVFLRILFAILFQLLFVGCFLQANISSIATLPAASPEVVSLGKVSSVENVAGATNYTRTAVSGFQVKQTAGLVLNRQS